jgi:hypothetical protein
MEWLISSRSDLLAAYAASTTLNHKYSQIHRPQQASLRRDL